MSEGTVITAPVTRRLPVKASLSVGFCAAIPSGRLGLPLRWTLQPAGVQKLQTALHAKAKAEPGYRFDQPRGHSGARLCSAPLHKGAPGVDRQDFEAVEAYGVERWLGELALALRQETYRPDPIRRVYIPKANGKLRPLGISTLRDRVCMTAAMLALEPIFEADLPSGGRGLDGAGLCGDGVLRLT